MNPQWIGATVAGVGLIANAAWTVINLRIENKMLKHIDEVKDWTLENFQLRPDAPLHRRHRRQATEIEG